ncbi:hypothetical protein AXF42_Ash018535 [Apostasia shenzhenica]|uniref:Uncharacterized protein n=1 Tax=Apostasia shenzhenica TaxID=1088818 RepID=A0A2I0APT0_9ASPA|nr:hypothetical protein AXF42_Ash018535 [Apostasia shenzhenica]
MDKNKSRTDLLAAGRKKLQQFRQKKDNKGGSSHVKSSSRASQPGKGGEAEEESKQAEVCPASAADLANARSSRASTSGSDGGAEELKMELEQLPASFDSQEANDSGLENSIGGNSHVRHEVVVTSSSGTGHQVDSTSTSSEVVPQREIGPSHSFVISQLENTENENGRGHELEKGAVEGETFSIVDLESVGVGDTNGPLFSINEVQGGALRILPDKMEKGPCLEEGLDTAASSQVNSALSAPSHGVTVASGIDLENRTSDRNKVEDLEKQAFGDEREGTTPAVLRSLGSEEDNRFFVLSGDTQELGDHISVGPDECCSLAKRLEIQSSCREIPVDREEISLKVDGKTSEDTVIEQDIQIKHFPVEDRTQGRHLEETISVSDDNGRESLSLQKCEIFDSSSVQWSEQDTVQLEESLTVGLESVRRHLFLSYVSNDILQVDLAGQIQINEDLRLHSSYEVNRLHDLVMEAQESKEMVSEELMQCKLKIQALAAEKNEFETNYISARKEIEELNHMHGNLHCKLHESQEDLMRASEDLAICKDMLDFFQKENTNLSASLFSETDSRKKLAQEVEFLSCEKFMLTASLSSEIDVRKKITEEKELLSGENTRLFSDLTAVKERLQISLEKQVQLQDELREMRSGFEEVVSDNFYLSGCLDIHKAKLKEMGSWRFEPIVHSKDAPISYEDAEEALSGNDVTSCRFRRSKQWSEKSDAEVASNIALNSVWPLVQDVDDNDITSHTVLKIFLKQLQVAKSTLQDMEKSIEAMSSHSLSLSGSGSQAAAAAAAAGVSKLIQAFESKAHLVGEVVDEVPLTDDARLEDSYTTCRDQILLITNTLNKMELDLKNSEIILREEICSKEILQKIEMDNKFQKQQNTILLHAVDQLTEKVTTYESKINELLVQIDELNQRASHEAAGFLSKIELQQKEVCELSIVKQERDAIEGIAFEAIGKLDVSTGLKVQENLDTASHVMFSVDAAILAIETLHDKVEEANINYNMLHSSYEVMDKSFKNMQSKNSIAMELLYKFYHNLTKLTKEAFQNADVAETDQSFENMLELLPDKFEKIIDYFQSLLNDHIHLLSRNDKLDADLLIRNQEIEALNTRCKELEFERNNEDGLKSALLSKLKEIDEVKRRCLVLANHLDDHKSIYSQSGSEIVSSCNNNIEVDSCNFVLSRLEELIAFHLQNCQELFEQIKLSIRHLREADILTEISANDWFLPLPDILSQVFIPEIFKLHENLKLLTSANMQQETEIQVMAEGMKKMKESLEASNKALLVKASEVEQSEQKLASVREKLSIAVAKGKGLIVQRDSFKQSLMAKTAELEKSTQELLSKEALLHELEAKLKSCSEVERIEALESELSYIRNSATALRDSFLQKDSMLQRIEEVLDDLGLPDDFHDKDIVEKIELLSTITADNHSAVANNWSQIGSEEHAHSDAVRCRVIDISKDGRMPSAYTDFEELKRKYEELQGKFYGLTEHSDMLEQSLLERNNIVQKWEEILDRIDIPSHMRTVEPEDKIEWLGREISEVKKGRDSLQLKIDNLEISSEMLIVDLEESHKKISELTAEVVAVKSEKEFFSESFEKLRFEFLALSEKAVHDELERENLQRELAGLQDKLAQGNHFEYCTDVDKYLQNLRDLINSALLESDKVKLLSTGNLTKDLEESLRKLIDNYTAYLNKSRHMVDDKELSLEESSPAQEGRVLEKMLHEKELNLASLRFQLDSTSSKLAEVEQERDISFGKCQSLKMEIEDLLAQIHVLSEERNEDTKKYQSLLLELDTMSKQMDSLQEQLVQEEQKSASVKEKLNVAVRKGKGLVQQRDGLKQTVDEMNAFIQKLQIEHNQKINVLESERSSLMTRLGDMEQNLRDSNQNYSKLLTALLAIDVGSESNEIDPVQKLGVACRILHDMRLAVNAAELEANKSKRAAELLLVELNEVQERADFLQDELAKAEDSLAACSKQKDNAVSHLEHIVSVHSEEKTRVANCFAELKYGIDQLKEGFVQTSRFLCDVLSRDVNLFHHVQNFADFVLDKTGNPDNDQLFLSSGNIFLPSGPKNEEIYCSIFDTNRLMMHPNVDGTLLFEHFDLAKKTLFECMRFGEDLTEKICKHSVFLGEETQFFMETVEAVKRKKSSSKDISDLLKRDVTVLESKLLEKDNKINSVFRNLTLLYEVCCTFMMEMAKRKSQALGEEDTGNLSAFMKLPSYPNEKGEMDNHSVDDLIKLMADSILSSLKDTSCTSELVERSQRELKDTISTLQRELQEKHIQMNKICEELVSQIRDADAVAKKSVKDLDSARMQASNLEKKVEEIDIDREKLESRLNELQDIQALSKLLDERINSLTDAVNAKDQEIEALMQALDEEETQMEALENRNKDMENLLQQKLMQLENLEASHARAMSKLSTTVNKFDELHDLSESLLTEIENLQSQLQERDSEISFLRQEVTRCTDDVLTSQETSKKNSAQLHELLSWMNAMASRFGETPVQWDQDDGQIHLFIDIMGKMINSVMTELSDLRVAVQSKDALVEIERGRVQELLSRAEILETSLHDKERIELSPGDSSYEQPSIGNSSGTPEMEQMVQRNKMSSGPVATHVRTGRKINNDQIAIAIDPERYDAVLDDEDDDKAHGFKSLTMSRLVPRATRPIADRIDAIWLGVR